MDRPDDGDRRTRRRVRVLVWAGAAVCVATLVALVHAVYPLLW
ncbi:hypothetical protein [Cellulomonas sp. S1-8]|nr:hypothetical protein [Cellulomonas sp. S1-8]UZN03520.1 hypothetical protein OKX07_00820 [Cellulomonas sp. S1-8]